MFRISRVVGADRGNTLSVEGRLVGPWVSELGRECETILSLGEPLTLDLGELMFVDCDGRRLLQSLAEKHVVLINCSPFITEQLKETATC